MHALLRGLVVVALSSLAACPKKKETTEEIVKPVDSVSSSSAVASTSASANASPSGAAIAASAQKPVLDALGNCTVGGWSGNGFGSGGVGFGGFGGDAGSGEGIGLGSIGTIGHGSGTGSGLGYGGPGIGGRPPLLAGTIFDVSGAIDAPAVGKTFCDGIDGFRACFVAASGAPNLRARETWDITLGAGGELAKYEVKLASGDSSLDACLLVALQSLRFPTASAETHFGYTLSYARRPKSVKMKETGIDVKGKLPPEVVRRIVRANFPRLRACYESLLTRSPAATGTVSVNFEIDATGAVTSAAPGTGTLTEPTFVACVVGVVRSISFPEPESGKVEVTYPLEVSLDDG